MRPIKHAEYLRVQNEFDVATRGMSHFSVIIQYADNAPTPDINETWEEIGFYGLLVPKAASIQEVSLLDGSVDKRTVSPAVLKIPKRFFRGGFKVSNPEAPSVVQGQEFSLSNQYAEGGFAPEQTLLLTGFILRSNYGEAPFDVNRLGTTYAFDTEFYESPDSVIIELKQQDVSGYTPWPNAYLTGIETPEVTTLVGRYGRDAALEMLGLS